jgi:hypothetical protein
MTSQCSHSLSDLAEERLSDLSLENSRLSLTQAFSRVISSKYSIDKKTDVQKLVRICKNSMRCVTLSELASLETINLEDRSKFISSLPEKHAEKIESETQKHKRIDLRTVLYDSIYWDQPPDSSKKTWFVRQTHLQQWFNALIESSDRFKNAIDAEFPLLLKPDTESTSNQSHLTETHENHHENPETDGLTAATPKKKRNGQYCVICCIMVESPVRQISSFHYEGEQLEELCTIVNSVRQSRPGRKSRKGTYTPMELIEQKMCISHLMEDGGINESINNRDFNTVRTTPETRRTRAFESLTLLKSKSAASILRTSQKVLIELTEKFISLSHRFNQSLGVINVDANLSDSIQQFIRSYSSFMRLTVKSHDEQMILDHWLNDDTFRHDTTFSTIELFLRFAEEHNLEILDLLTAIFYLNGYSYRDIWARFPQVCLSLLLASTIIFSDPFFHFHLPPFPP